MGCVIKQFLKEESLRKRDLSKDIDQLRQFTFSETKVSQFCRGKNTCQGPKAGRSVPRGFWEQPLGQHGGRRVR